MLVSWVFVCCLVSARQLQLKQLMQTPDLTLCVCLCLCVQQEHWFEKALTEKKGFVIKKMKEDGACLFRAVGECQTQTRVGFQSNSPVL